MPSPIEVWSVVEEVVVEDVVLSVSTPVVVRSEVDPDTSLELPVAFPPEADWSMVDDMVDDVVSLVPPAVEFWSIGDDVVVDVVASPVPLPVEV